MTQESFLPEGYKEPVKSNYMSFIEGNNTFRILGPAKVGNEYWSEELVDGVKKGVSHRLPVDAKIPLDKVMTDKFGQLNCKFFWAFPVYNFNAQKIQILQIKQPSIRKQMTPYLDNPKWGNKTPFEYNFTVTSGKSPDGKTVYQTVAEPKEAIDEKILKDFKELNLDMQTWMDGKDPFNSKLEKGNEEMPSF